LQVWDPDNPILVGSVNTWSLIQSALQCIDFPWELARGCAGLDTLPAGNEADGGLGNVRYQVQGSVNYVSQEIVEVLFLLKLSGEVTQCLGQVRPNTRPSDSALGFAASGSHLSLLFF
jgi:hypothetical protein